MVIFNKIVKRYNDAGMIQMPGNTIGMEFYIVSKEDLDRTYELLDSSMIKLKVYEIEMQKLKTDLEQFKNISNSRLTYLEKIISFTTSKPQIEGESKENVDLQK